VSLPRHSTRARLLHRWLKLADIEDGTRPGVTAAESAELRELRRRNRLLEQENEPWP